MPWLLLLLLINGCASLTTSPRTSVEAVIQSHMEDSQNLREPQAVPRFVHPVSGTSAVSSSFGLRGGRSHQGLDFVSRWGTPIQAAAPGEVIYVGDGIDRYGVAIILKHEGGYFTLYAHLSETRVTEGEEVSPGIARARSGDTGNATGPHLHFEIRKGIQPLDPLSIAAHLGGTSNAE
jgi:murein DD-endopeptidase MepM/ murein hydrolase activator NlpD